jgi:hypothetical protein
MQKCLFIDTPFYLLRFFLDLRIYFYVLARPIITSYVPLLRLARANSSLVV